MPYFKTYKSLLFPSGTTKVLLILLIFVLLTFIDALVEYTGGTAFAYLHLLYIPIIVAGFVFSVSGGILAGVVAGVLMSPLLPSYTPYDISQPFSSWALRLVIFSLVGGLAGMGSSILKAYVIELEKKWITNSLTGLPNLHGLLQEFSEFTQDKEKGLIILVCKLNHLAEIDRAFGEEKTNSLIKTIAQDLKAAVGGAGILGLLQSHQFVVLIREGKNLQDILKGCESVFEATYSIGSIPIFIETQFGIARYPKDDKDLNGLIRKAVRAMKAKKDEGARVSYFDKSMVDSSEHNLFVLFRLKAAIEENALSLDYQPKVNLKTGKVMGFEALVRWIDPLLGRVSPADFIPLAEETLLINSFTKWLLGAVIRQIQVWEKEGVLIPISVNLSVKNIQDPSLIETFIHLLEKSKIPPHFFEIEITETSITTHLSEISNTLRKLREFGIRISIDDYGTGQASQQYLFDLPITTIKIDKLFVDSIALSPTAVAIVKNSISLAHDLKLDVVAEGIETLEQYDLLKKWKCDGVQGYFISPPLNPKEATQWLKARD